MLRASKLSGSSDATWTTKRSTSGLDLLLCAMAELPCCPRTEKQRHCVMHVHVCEDELVAHAHLSSPSDLLTCVRCSIHLGVEFEGEIEACSHDPDKTK